MSGFEARLPELAAAETQAKINLFAIQNRLERREYLEWDGRRMVTLEPGRLEPIDPGRLTHYFAAQAEAEARGIAGNCWGIASDANFNGHARSRMFTSEGATDFCGYDDHEINLDTLHDGSVLALDLTAAVNLDHNQGGMAIFGLRAKRVGKLVVALNKLYGGSWREARYI